MFIVVLWVLWSDVGNESEDEPVPEEIKAKSYLSASLQHYATKKSFKYKKRCT